MKEANMRVLGFCIVIALWFLATHGTEANEDRINSPESYKGFIKGVRQQLGFETFSVYGITVLSNSVQNSNRFSFTNITITTSNGEEQAVTLAIDVQDSNLVAYCVRGEDSYFFPNAPRLAFLSLFDDTQRILLKFNNTFQSLEDQAGKKRQKIELGAVPLQLAISNLYNNQRELVPESLLVIIQMIIEASKFRFIEQSIANSMRDGQSFTPNLAILSLEDNWSDLSLQIQASSSVQGVFGRGLDFYNSNDEVIPVDSIYMFPFVLANIVLMKYHCQQPSSTSSFPDSYIRMRSMDEDNNNNNDVCNLEASSPTRISGQDGLCATLSSASPRDGSNILLSPCQQDETSTQQWTFYRDKTIRSMGKCLATRSSRFGNTLDIYSCNKLRQKEATWSFLTDQTILSPGYNLVVTAQDRATRGNRLIAEINKYNADQSWRAGVYVKPIIASIIGLNEMCLEATNSYKSVWLENCVKNKMEQSWAIYGDGTIRPVNNRGLCLNSYALSTEKLIVLRICGRARSDVQRWSFDAQGTMFNPKYESLRMEVAESNVNLKKLLLNPRNDKPSQQWVVYY